MRSAPFSPRTATLLLLGTLALPRTMSGDPTSTHKTTPPAATAAALSSATNALSDEAANLRRVTEANQDLLDLLKRQQAVLEDIEYDRRLQARQISNLEERLQDALQQNAQLQEKVAKLEDQISGNNVAPSSSAPAGSAPAPKPANAPPPPPATYLPAPESAGAPGTMWWHRIVSLSGNDTKSSAPFHIAGRQWRVVWHNQDQPGAAYANTSALFINAFPQGDTVPQKVCSKLGSGGDATELTGPGNFFLKVEASGGSWELAVEDFR